MNSDERQFEDFVSEIKFDDSPDYSHRDRLEQDLLAALTKQSRQKEQPLQIWRTIMKSQITKFAAAAAIIVAAVLSITILDKSATPAYAVTDLPELFEQAKVIHIQGRQYFG